METVTVVKDKGIIGDRYSIDSNRKSFDYQITFIEKEVIDLFNQENEIKNWILRAQAQHHNSRGEVK
jgi:hypothetical protein